ncbi:hypothetical protein GQS40_00915|uniref:Uncharacterized protein n=1 Tax=Leuconostoc lactis TaxID=1246 RepID=A0A6L7A974_LEULA|nr:hypothetical protein [Leuconostoc lactis]
MLEFKVNFEKNIAVLASAKGQPIPWPAGPYPAYSVDILALAQSYFKSAEFDRNFDRTLRQHGFHEGVPEAVVAEIMILLMVAGNLWGIVGMILIVPVYAILRVVVQFAAELFILTKSK